MSSLPQLPSLNLDKRIMITFNDDRYTSLKKSFMGGKSKMKPKGLEAKNRRNYRSLDSLHLPTNNIRNFNSKVEGKKIRGNNLSLPNIKSFSRNQVEPDSLRKNLNFGLKYKKGDGITNQRYSILSCRDPVSYLENDSKLKKVNDNHKYLRGMIHNAKNNQKKQLELKTAKETIPNLCVYSSDNKLISDLKNSFRKLDNIDKLQISKIQENFFTENDQKSIDMYKRRLSDFSIQPWVKIIDILIQANICKLKVDEKTLKGYLTRKSMIPGKVSGKVIKKDLLPIFRAPPPLKKPSKKPPSGKRKLSSGRGKKKGCVRLIETRDKNSKGSLLHPESQVHKSKEEQINKRNQQTQQLIFRISEALFMHEMSVCDWLTKGIKENPRTLIRDKVIDGHEYQLVKRDNLFDALEEIGIVPTLRDRDNLRHILGTTFLDFVDLNTILGIFSKLGINEDVPESTRILNFSIFNGDCIRTYNRIIQCMEREGITQIEEWLPQSIIEPFQIVSKDKERTIGTISVEKMTQFFRNKKIIGFGEELNEFFIEFLELSPDHDHLIMVKKLKKSLAIVKKCRYYDYFGTYKRTGVVHRKCDINRLFKGLKMSEEEFMIMKENLKEIDVRKNQMEALRKILAIWKANICRKNSIKDYVEKARNKFKEVLSKNKVVAQFQMAVKTSNLSPKARRRSLKKSNPRKIPVKLGIAAKERSESILSFKSEKSEFGDSNFGFSQTGFNKGYSKSFLRKRFGLH